MAQRFRIPIAGFVYLLFLSGAFSQELRTILTEEKILSQAEAGCYAGTVSVGQTTGQSNDTDLPTLFLCWGDSVLIDHNGDQVIMDPDPSTAPGIAYAFFSCPPTDTSGLNDPCLWPGAVGSGFFATSGPPSGDHWFFNTGGLFNASTFCGGSPCQIYFAPIVIGDFANGQIEPGCVNINTDAVFSVVYLREITINRPDGSSTVDTGFGTGCIARFQLRGGLPEYDFNAHYAVDIYLSTDSTVKALIHTVPDQWKHNGEIIFSVPKAGVYTVSVGDGKSCGLSFEIDMSACNAFDNAVLAISDGSALPERTVCLPLATKNLGQALHGTFSVAWDTTFLNFEHVQQLHSFVSLGNSTGDKLGFEFIGSPGPNGIVIPDKTTLLTICFKVLGPPSETSVVRVVGEPESLDFVDINGKNIAVTAKNGVVTSRCRCPK